MVSCQCLQGVRWSWRTSSALAQSVLLIASLSIVVGVVEGAKKSAGTAEGTCDADAKGVISAGKKLTEELAAMKKVDSLGSIEDVSRTWYETRRNRCPRMSIFVVWPHNM